MWWTRQCYEMNRRMNENRGKVGCYGYALHRKIELKRLPDAKVAICIDRNLRKLSPWSTSSLIHSLPWSVLFSFPVKVHHICCKIHICRFFWPCFRYIKHNILVKKSNLSYLSWSTTCCNIFIIGSLLQTYRIEAVQIKFEGYSLLLMDECIYRVDQIRTRIDRIMSRQIKWMMQWFSKDSENCG